jgi:DNA-binding Xre family transcriptional regulator
MKSKKNKYWLTSDDDLDVAMVRAGVRNKRDLAEKSGIDYFAFTHLGTRPVTMKKVEKICLTLHVSTDNLFKLAAKK